MKKGIVLILLSMIGLHAFSQTKPLEIICTTPKMLKAGASFQLRVIVKHQISTEKTGTLSLSLLNHQTGKSVDGWFLNIFPFQYFTTIKNENFEVEFPFTVPHEFKGDIDISLVAQVEQMKDSIRYTIPTQHP
jgi:hypothetical protein